LRRGGHNQKTNELRGLADAPPGSDARPNSPGDSDFLDNNSTIVDAVQRDLQRGLKNPGTGRDGLTAQQVLRAPILKRVKNWDLRELRERIADGISLHQFTDFYSGTVPEHQRFNHAFNRLTAKTVKIVIGSKLRTDTTVVQTNIHPLSVS
jgi:IS5 family transposase